MADGTLAEISWSRADASGFSPAHSMRRGGRWLTLAWAEVGGRVRDAAEALPALGGKRGEAVALSARNRAERVWADCTPLYLDLFDAPDEETAARVVMIVRSYGHAQTETSTAMPWDRFESLLSTVVVAA